MTDKDKREAFSKRRQDLLQKNLVSESSKVIKKNKPLPRELKERVYKIVRNKEHSPQHLL
jgi:hypothetical protein